MLIDLGIIRLEKGMSALALASSVYRTAADAKHLHDYRKKNSKSQKAVAGALFNNKKYRNEDGSLNDEGKARKSKGKQYTEDYWNAHDNKDPKYMSDKELQRRINRLNNENQYKNLTESYTKKKGRKLANDVVDKALIGIVTAAAVQATRKYGPKLIKKGKDYIKNRNR